ncbi:transcription elongation factor GreAB (plasmid) [Rhizobium leguminosarum]|uniref:transcription elongation factor GreAB n=1 Tax=Rhizobium leguminosarum TaxID=384 RepID=UPI0010304134|nr:transcription elongation factor GreAB [Rhizobium leguminosarum]NKK93894.1 transcription elongation factor GreAB [Rhizobium leguminosarum bv. viciae]TAU86599.1 transcription elongation factor GreAB [Rhizobium leguminosarum]TAU99421.1 transcription elongation factor GreAB [Rhizobium leguminosarum]TAW41459.1 transcription elongation factor GreAB [Rhizobium leguminosarum]TAY26763.1 transcription elongation factor GreAB [Rhizobium leguminosarum]
MSREAFYQLTAEDANVLMSMLERQGDRPGPFAAVLREKFNRSSVFSREDIPPDVVTIDTQFIYTINGVRVGPHVLVHKPAGGLPKLALSVCSMRGLALLGLAIGEKTEIPGNDAEFEVLTVESVLFQPEAETRPKEKVGGAAELIDQAPQVVDFRPRHRKPVISDDDDPGPSAA